MGDKRDAYVIWWGDLRERVHSEDLGVDGRIILKRIFKKWVGGHGLVCSGSGYGHVEGACKCGDEFSGDWLRYTKPFIPTDRQTEKRGPLYSSFTCLSYHSIKAV